MPPLAQPTPGARSVSSTVDVCTLSCDYDRVIVKPVVLSPTRRLCAADWYRTSGDINAGQNSWFENLQSVVPYAKKPNPLSSPGCWAYPEFVHCPFAHMIGTQAGLYAHVCGEQE